jgi:hypothetical protein
MFRTRSSACYQRPFCKGGGADGFRQDLGLPDAAKIKELQKELKAGGVLRIYLSPLN